MLITRDFFFKKKKKDQFKAQQDVIFVPNRLANFLRACLYLKPAREHYTHYNVYSGGKTQ